MRNLSNLAVAVVLSCAALAAADEGARPPAPAAPRPTTAPTTRPAGPIGVIQGLIELKDEEIDYAEACFSLAAAFDPNMDANAHMARFEGMVSALRGQLTGPTHPRTALHVIANHLFRQQEFRSVPLDVPNPPRLLHETLAVKAGTAYTLSLLYAALGQRLGLGLEVVPAPRHALVRYDRHGIVLRADPLLGGKLYENAAFTRRFASVSGSHYLQPLTRRQVLGLALSQQAVWLGERGAAKAAAVCHQAAIHLLPESPEVHVAAGAFLRAVGQHANARKMLAKAIEGRERYPEAWMHRGLSLLAEKKVDEALLCMDRAVEYAPRLPATYLNRARALMAAGKRKQAVADYHRALKLDKNLFDAWFGAGTALWQMEDHAHALTCLDQAVRLQPKAALAHMIRAMVLDKLGRHDDAWTALRRAAELGIKPPEKLVRALRAKLEADEG